MLVPVESDRFVRFVREDAHVRASLFEYDLRELRELCPRRDTTRRIGWEVQEDQAGLLTQQRFERRAREAEAVFFPEHDRDRATSEVRDEGLEEWIPRRRVDYLLASLTVRHVREADGGAPARIDHHALRPDVEPVFFAERPRHRGAQLGDALRIAIRREPRVQRTLDRVGDVLRHREVWLPQVASDDPFTLSLDLRDRRSQREGGFGADAVDSVGEEACGRGGNCHCVGGS